MAERKKELVMASNQLSASLTLDDCFSFDVEWVMNHRSYASISTSHSKGQSLTEQVFALPKQLFLQYISFQPLRLNISYFIGKYGTGELEDNLIDSWKSLHDWYFLHTDQKNLQSLRPLLLEFLRKFLSFLMQHLSSLENGSFSILSKTPKYTTMGWICHITGGLQNHLSCIHTLVSHYHQVIASFRWPTPSELHFLSRNVLLVLRAAKHVESICLIGKRHQIEHNPALRYYIERFVLSSPFGKPKVEEKIPYYLINFEVASYLILLSPEEDDKSLRMLLKHYRAIFFRRPSEQDVVFFPTFVLRGDASHILNLPVERRRKCFYFLQKIVAVLAPFLALFSTLSKRQKLASSISELFLLSEFNSFWESLLKQENVNIEWLISKFEEWFQLIICCLVSHSDLRSPMGKVCRFSLLLRATSLMIRFTKAELISRREPGPTILESLEKAKAAEIQKLNLRFTFEEAKSLLLSE